MRIPLWLIGVAFVGYSVWAVNFWCCKMCQCCDGQAPRPITTGVPLFKWNASTPEADPNFDKWKKQLLDDGGTGDTLAITGWYRHNETGGVDLGLQRATAIKAMLAPELPDSRVRVFSKEVKDELAEGGPAMESADFDWLKFVLKKEEDKVVIIESDKDVTFLFPYNSTERIRDQGVDDYVRTLVGKHKDGGATFSIVGHTDDQGSEEYNLRLGKARADAISQLLVANGIEKSRIQTASKGESEPAESNATEEGQRLNRRVVLTVVPNNNQNQ